MTVENRHLRAKHGLDFPGIANGKIAATKDGALVVSEGSAIWR